MNRSVAFHTLGCKLNFSETSTLGRMLEEEGFVRKPFESEADVYVINTCSVTENADRECRQIVRRIRRRAPESTIVVTGCYAQLKPGEIAGIEGVDLVLGAAEKFNLARHLKTTDKSGAARICSCDISDLQGFRAAWSLHDRTRTFLKVQDGCDYPCTYCTIPLARGHSRSDTIAGVLEHAHTLAHSGVKEIVLTGVNLGDFGKGDEGGRQSNENFSALVQALDEVPGIERYRISSIEPNLLTDDIIAFVARSGKFMPHFHIPLQSGSDRILGLMRRRYRRELYAERVALIRRLMPHACIGADVIVGFPSESEADFEATFDFLQDVDVSYLHVFTYSERNDTEALRISPVVPVPVRQERNQRLRQLSVKKMQHFTAQQRGQKRPVLFEEQHKEGLMEGYTDNYIRVSAPYQEDLVNRVVEWVL
ncbi:tRNA (N(6)-L-threonylcarbamoyladenosine(37)-C(2))-methylthiotransferase MtaB [Compostibacter hankyongensis]|uniref:tRNA (N(6)-L-threonylcarbamoyladenosine(37)-C(2))-methylthiotransferase MtaB n=1 Tax=Compostibacter hankyongensis TaxID=1007089 RepID=A0ABP8G8R4_9BACT